MSALVEESFGEGVVCFKDETPCLQNSSVHMIWKAILWMYVSRSLVVFRREGHFCIAVFQGGLFQI